MQIWNGAIKKEIKKNGERRAWQKNIEMVINGKNRERRAVIKWSRRGSIDGWIGQKINGGIDEWTHEGTHRQTERWMDERGHKSQKWLLSSGSDLSKNEFLKCRLPPSSSLTHCLSVHPSICSLSQSSDDHRIVPHINTDRIHQEESWKQRANTHRASLVAFQLIFFLLLGRVHINNKTGSQA